MTSEWFLKLGRGCLWLLSHPHARKTTLGRTWQDGLAWALAAQRHDGQYQTGSGQALQLVVAGDSIACGLGLASHDESIAGRLVARLAAERRVSCLNVGVHGSRSRHIEQQLAPHLPLEADIVLLASGSKDLVSGQPLRSFRRDWQRIFALVAHIPSVIVIGPGNPADIGSMPRFLVPLANHRYRRYNQALREVASAYPNILVTDIGQLQPGNEHFAADGYHPNADGHGLIFSRVEALIDRLVF